MKILTDISGTGAKTSDWISVDEGRTVVIQASGLGASDVIQVHQQFRLTTQQVYENGDPKELTSTNTITAVHGPMWFKLTKGTTQDVEVGLHRDCASGMPVV